MTPIETAPSDTLNDAIEEAVSRLVDADESAAQELLQLAYGYFRRAATRIMGAQDGTPTLSATALVHESYLKLLRGKKWHKLRDARHFHRLVCRVIQHAMVSYERTKQAKKRGGNSARVCWDIEILERPFENSFCTILELNDALEVLGKQSPRTGEVVRLRYFARLTIEETADLLQCSRATVNREMDLAKARLRLLLEPN